MVFFCDSSSKFRIKIVEDRTVYGVDIFIELVRHFLDYLPKNKMENGWKKCWFKVRLSYFIYAHDAYNYKGFSFVNKQFKDRYRSIQTIRRFVTRSHTIATARSNCTINNFTIKLTRCNNKSNQFKTLVEFICSNQ